MRYMHSDVETLERIEIIRDLRLGAFDVLIGINLLREGLDIPECALVAILDADKEGFLRSETSLIQTIGRAARNVDGKVILYADQHHRLDGAGDGRDQRAAARSRTPTTRRTASRPPASRSKIADIMGSHVRARPCDGGRAAAGCAEDGRDFVGHNIKAHHRRASKSRCATPPPTWSSRKPRGCATSSSGCNRGAGDRRRSLRAPERRGHGQPSTPRSPIPARTARQSRSRRPRRASACGAAGCRRRSGAGHDKRATRYRGGATLPLRTEPVR